MGKLKTLIAENVKPLSVKLEQLVESAELAQSLQKEIFEAGPPIQLFKDELSRKQQRLRPSIGRISLVSFHPKSPQMGPNNYHSRISNAASLRRAVKTEVLEPGRKVPEKRLQSWLIREAWANGQIMKSLNDVLGGEYWFVSDELAIKINESNKVVADLLLVKVDNGLAKLVNVELKSERARKEVFNQVIDFRDVIEHETLFRFWRQFAETMTCHAFRWDESPQTHGIVVWPKSENPKAAQNSEHAALVEYLPDGENRGDGEYPSNYTLNLPAIATM